MNKFLFPAEYTSKSIVVYMVIMALLSVSMLNLALPFWLLIFDFVGLLLFFYGTYYFTRAWSNFSSRKFDNRLFWIALVIRLAYVIFIYNFNWIHYGTFHESDVADIGFYTETSQVSYNFMFTYGYTPEMVYAKYLEWKIEYSDMGYIIYLLIVKILTRDIHPIIPALLLKALFGALTCLYMTRIARNHFSEGVARLTGIFCMLQTNMIWWCGSMMKETEMVFVMVMAIYYTDSIFLSDQKWTWKTWIRPGIFMVIMGFLRTTLLAVEVLSLAVALLMSSQRVIGTQRRVIGIVMILGFIVVLMTGFLGDELQGLEQKATNSDYQQNNMEWRTRREHGNKYAKYAGAAVFAPLIFTIPFPTMLYTRQGQEMQMMMAPGYYEKNLMSFFVIFIMFAMLKPYNKENIFVGEWRRHVYIIASLVGYLAALALSAFGHSGRFHFPAIPLEMMFAAYGMERVLQTGRKNWFDAVLLVEVLICLGWNIFKLSGQGLI
ncbi:MAG: hypothetical protein IKN91_04760 [Paludibacteraceae bacterium]|nr:hypothetical protein [Paludibacteraceae bacterium]